MKRLVGFLDFLLFLLWQLPFAIAGFILFWLIGYPWIAFRAGWEFAGDFVKPNGERDRA